MHGRTQRKQTGARVIKPRKAAAVKQQKMKKVRLLIYGLMPSFGAFVNVRVEALCWFDCCYGKVSRQQGGPFGDAEWWQEGQAGEGCEEGCEEEVTTLLWKWRTEL